VDDHVIVVALVRREHDRLVALEQAVGDLAIGEVADVVVEVLAELGKLGLERRDPLIDRRLQLGLEGFLRGDRLETYQRERGLAAKPVSAPRTWRNQFRWRFLAWALMVLCRFPANGAGEQPRFNVRTAVAHKTAHLDERRPSCVGAPFRRCHR
jgi:hypothetical protein